MSQETIKTYQGGADAGQALVTLEGFIGDMENLETVDDGTVDASDAVTAINALIWSLEKRDAEIEKLRAALEPFAEVARWAERNGHDLLKGWDMLLRQPDGGFAGHLQVQSPDFIAALTALGHQQKGDKS